VTELVAPIATMFLRLQPGGESVFENASGYVPVEPQHLSVRVVGVPEPGTLGLLVLGFAGVALLGGRARSDFHRRCRQLSQVIHT
jgi:hypothetical protein